MKTLYQQSLEKIDITEIKATISTLDQYSPKNPKLTTNKKNRENIPLKERIKMLKISTLITKIQIVMILKTLSQIISKISGR